MGCVNCKNIWRRFFPSKQEKITSSVRSVREEVILAGRDEVEIQNQPFPDLQKTVSDSSLISPSELRDTVPPELSENELGRREPDTLNPDRRSKSPDPAEPESEASSKSDFSKVENPDEVQVQNHEVQTDPPADPTSDSDWQDVNSN